MEATHSYDEFLHKELAELHSRLLEKHNELAKPMVFHEHAKDKDPRHKTGGSSYPHHLPEVVMETVRRRRPSELSQLSMDRVPSIIDDYDITGSINYKLRWGEFALGLLERQDPDEELHEETLPSLELDLHPAWTMGWDQARQHRRRRHSSVTSDLRTKTLRFNDVFTDDKLWIQRCVVGPDSRVQLLWAAMASLFIIWDMVTIPLQLFPLNLALENTINTITLVSFVYWVLDVPLHFIFGVQVGGAIEMRPQKLFKMYLRSWLLADLIVILVDTAVIVLTTFQASTNPLYRSGRFVRGLRMVRLIRLLRVAKLEREFMLVANYFLSAYGMMALKLGSYLALMLAVNHLIACFWYGVGVWSKDPQLRDGNWLERSDIDQSDFGASYIAAMHWSLTQFTPSTNPIAPANTWERFFAIWVILLAMACFSSFIGSIGASVNSMRMARREELLQTAKLERFFMERNLSVDLFTKVQSAVKHDGLIKMRLEEEEVGLIKNIPERFKMMLHGEMFRPALFRIGIWPSRLNDEDGELMASICHSCMCERACKLGQDIFFPRTKGGFAYVVQSGTLEYDVKGYVSVTCQPESGTDVLSVPALWVEWTHVGRLSGAGFGACNYVSIDAAEFCWLALRWGGPLCEYLKTVGLLIVQTIEALNEKGTRVTDIFDAKELKLQTLIPRAEQFVDLKHTASRRFTARDRTFQT